MTQRISTWRSLLISWPLRLLWKERSDARPHGSAALQSLCVSALCDITKGPNPGLTRSKWRLNFILLE